MPGAEGAAIATCQVGSKTWTKFIHIETLEDLPEGEYTNMADVMKGYGEARGHSA
jgi:hypothetical protein